MKHRNKTTKPRAGRPISYTSDLAQRICRLLSEGRSLRSICRDKNFPAETTIRRWVLEDRCGFAALYRHAREMGWHRIADQCLEIADNDEGDFVVSKASSSEVEPSSSEENVTQQKDRTFSSEAEPGSHEEGSHEENATKQKNSAAAGSHESGKGSKRGGAEKAPVLDRNNITRAKLRIDTRKWLLSKMLPKTCDDDKPAAKHDYTNPLVELMKAIDGRTRGIPEKR